MVSRVVEIVAGAGLIDGGNVVHGWACVDGFPIVPIRKFLYLVEYGQPNRSEGGLYFGNVQMVGAPEDTQFGRYRSSEWRYGKVVALGSEVVRGGELELGDVVLYSRRFGSRLGTANRFKVPEYQEPLNVRVFSMDQIEGVVDDFTPWWDVEESQLDPDGVMTG